MSDALDILTRGLTVQSGLSVATRGLLLGLSPTSILGASGASLPLDAGSITDVLLRLPEGKTADADVVVEGGQLSAEHGLLGAVVLSLFCDRLAEADDRLPTDDGDRRGWWGDAYPRVPGDRIGSRFWLLHREKQTQQTLNRGEEYTREALDWMIEDGVASAVSAAASWLQRHVMGLEVGIDRPTKVALRMRWAVAWEAL